MSSFISLQEAVNMTEAFREKRESILQPEFQDQNVLCICETFEKSMVETVLDQEDCEGLRIYYGMDEDSKVHAILVGVNGENEDIVVTEAAEAFSEMERSLFDEGTFLENGQRCPEECPPGSPLNGGGRP